MHPLLNTAVKAARKAGAIINRASLDLDLLRVSTKGHADFVTEVDKAAEQSIIETLSQAYPDHGFLAEESGARRPAASSADYTWIIDPLDGTTNFIHGFPQYAVSIACQHGGQITQAVIYDPSRNDLFTATRGRGAFLNDRRLRVSKRTQLKECLLATGFPFRSFDRLDAYLQIFKRVTACTAGIRRPGAAALDLAYVAAGRFDGFWEYGLAPWDMAAGSLLVIEAGGLISDDEGKPDYLSSGNVVCGAPKVHEQLLRLMRGQEPETAGDAAQGGVS
jgi:myo-inositol-1(or 4)-monophosphatase